MGGKEENSFNTLEHYSFPNLRYINVWQNYFENIKDCISFFRKSFYTFIAVKISMEVSHLTGILPGISMNQTEKVLVNLNQC